jgi:hypothetical protein
MGREKVGHPSAAASNAFAVPISKDCATEAIHDDGKLEKRPLICSWEERSEKPKGKVEKRKISLVFSKGVSYLGSKNNGGILTHPLKQRFCFLVFCSLFLMKVMHWQSKKAAAQAEGAHHKHSGLLGVIVASHRCCQLPGHRLLLYHLQNNRHDMLLRE